MQRHFSNRGEALAEVTAARMLVGRKRSARSEFTTRPVGGLSPSNGSLSLRKQRLRPKKKQPNRNVDVTPLL